MNRYALIINGIVSNVVESEAAIDPVAAGCDVVVDISGQSVGPGHKYQDGIFIFDKVDPDPMEPTIDILKGLTGAELSEIRKSLERLLYIIGQ